MAEETAASNGSSKGIVIEETGMVSVNIGGKQLDVDVFEEMMCLQKMFDPVRDKKGGEWTYEVKRRLQEEHGITVSIMAATSYFEQLMEEHERISDFFDSTPASPTTSESIPEDSADLKSGDILSTSEDSKPKNPSGE